MVFVRLAAFQTGTPTSPFFSGLPFVLETCSRFLQPGRPSPFLWSILCAFFPIALPKRLVKSYHDTSTPPGTPQAFDLRSGSKNLRCTFQRWALSAPRLMQLALSSRKGRQQKGWQGEACPDLVLVEFASIWFCQALIFLGCLHCRIFESMHCLNWCSLILAVLTNSCLSFFWTGICLCPLSSMRFST